MHVTGPSGQQVRGHSDVRDRECWAAMVFGGVWSGVLLWGVRPDRISARGAEYPHPSSGEGRMKFKGG